MKVGINRRIVLFDSTRDVYDYEEFVKFTELETKMKVKPFQYYKARSPYVSAQQMSLVKYYISIPKSQYLPIYSTDKIKSGMKVSDLDPLAIVEIGKFTLLTPILLTDDEINDTQFDSLERIVYCMKEMDSKKNEMSIITYCRFEKIIVNFSQKFAEKVKKSNQLIQ